MTDQEVKDRLSDLHAYAITLDAEGRGDWREGNSSVEERLAIGCVIRNRAMTPRRWPSTYRGVCLQRGQFSCWFLFGGAANYRRTMAIARGFVEGVPMPALSVLERELLHESVFLAEGLIGGQLLDRVGGANHYYAPAAMTPRGSAPAWAIDPQTGHERVPAAVVGSQKFFKL